MVGLLLLGLCGCLLFFFVVLFILSFGAFGSRKIIWVYVMSIFPAGCGSRWGICDFSQRASCKLDSFIPPSETEWDPEFHTTVWNRKRVSYHHLKQNETQSFIPLSETEWDPQFHTTIWNGMRPRVSYHHLKSTRPRVSYHSLKQKETVSYHYLKQNETQSFIPQSETERDPEFHTTVWNRMRPRVSYHNLKWHEAQSACAESTHKGLISAWKTSHKHNKDLSHLQ